MSNENEEQYFIVTLVRNQTISDAIAVKTLAAIYGDRFITKMRKENGLDAHAYFKHIIYGGRTQIFLSHSAMERLRELMKRHEDDLVFTVAQIQTIGEESVPWSFDTHPHYTATPDWCVKIWGNGSELVLVDSHWEEVLYLPVVGHLSIDLNELKEGHPSAYTTLTSIGNAELTEKQWNFVFKVFVEQSFRACASKYVPFLLMAEAGILPFDMSNV